MAFAFEAPRWVRGFMSVKTAHSSLVFVIRNLLELSKQISKKFRELRRTFAPFSSEREIQRLCFGVLISMASWKHSGSFWIAWQLGPCKECQHPGGVGSNLRDLTPHGTNSRGACEGRSESLGELVRIVFVAGQRNPKDVLVAPELAWPKVPCLVVSFL